MSYVLQVVAWEAIKGIDALDEFKVKIGMFDQALE